jgi:Fur family ferric uptake transcriptional regulator
VVITKEREYGYDFSQNGLKSTKRRAEILKILEDSDQPLSAEQVFLDLKKKNIEVSLSTVYRALEAISKKNLALKLNIPGDQKTLFEYNRRVHKHYLICLGCNKIRSINSCPLGDYEESLADELHYSILGHQLDIYGYCPECRERNTPQDK